MALYDENEQLSEVGNRYDNKIKTAILPIIQEAVQEGIPLRELAELIHETTMEEILSALLTKMFKPYQ